MDARKLKEGTIMRYKTVLLGKKWKECHAVLFSDSSFCWYDKKGDSRPAGKVLLKDYIPYICVGLLCDRMPIQRPKLPDNYSVHHLVGIGMDPQANKVFWFLFSSDSDLESWFNEITKTLPKPVQPASQLPPNVPTSVPHYNPPAVYPASAPLPPVQQYSGGQPSLVGYSSPPYSSYRPVQGIGGNTGYGPASYGSGAPQTTVVIQDRGYSSGNSSGPAFGTGLGAGILMGSLLGYGVGSFWGGGFYPSCGFGGHGMAYGMGGGYVQDNDTYITNNYYGGAGPETDAAQNTLDDNTMVGNDVDNIINHDGDTGAVDGNNDHGADYDYRNGDYDDYGGVDFGGDDFGGGEFGGDNFDGGDFGDFGGGDF